HHQLRVLAVALVQARQGMQEQLRPNQHFTPRENDPAHRNVVRVGQVVHALRGLLRRQSGRPRLRVVVAVPAALVAIARDDPVYRVHDPAGAPRLPSGYAERTVVSSYQVRQRTITRLRKDDCLQYRRTLVARLPRYTTRSLVVASGATRVSSLHLRPQRSI